jgi:hypothetical protein
MSSNFKWTAELKKIEREFEGLPPLPTSAQKQARRLSERKTLERTLARRATVDTVLGFTARIGLVTALAVAMPFWPYRYACGWGLMSYLAAGTLVGVGAVWCVTWTWRERMPRLHGVSIALIIWGVVLLAIQVIPRLVSHAQPWWC